MGVFSSLGKEAIVKVRLEVVGFDITKVWGMGSLSMAVRREFEDFTSTKIGLAHKQCMTSPF